MKRIKFISGSDRFEVEDKTFVKGGPSIEVSNDLADYLLSFPGYEFDEISAEEAKAEDKLIEQAGARNAREAASYAEAEAAEAEAAARRAVFYEGAPVEVAEEVDVPVAEVPAEPVVEDDKNVVEDAVDFLKDLGHNKGSQSSN